jgi:DNA-binding CsgD family transcriptional regulator
MTKKLAASHEWFDEMQSLFAQAKFSAAGHLYDEAVQQGAVPPYNAYLLRARTLLAQDENKAVAFLIQRPPKSRVDRDRGLWALLLGIGYARMRDFERADHHFDIARRTLTTPEERARVAYHIARRWMLEGRMDEARRFADEMSEDRSRDTKIKQELLQSFILSHEERYQEAAENLIQAIELIGKHRGKYLEDWFHAVQNLAALGRELPFERASELARSEVDQDIEWPDDFRTQRFQALKAVGWSCALRGDLLGCFRYLRGAERVAPSGAFEAIVLLDRAYFARISGEQNWALNEVAKAEAIAERVDWNALGGDERIGLLLLAEALADSNHEKAHFYLARYKGLDRIRSPLHLFAFDHRVEAFAAYAEGAIKVAEGDQGAAEVLRKAWVIFDRIGYDWRAGRTAMRLMEATKKDRWRHLAEDKLEAYPRSWLARELRELASPALPAVELPPMQRKVFDLLCAKLSTAEIAQSLGLSQHTVRNHLKGVFRAYGVNNRAALVAEAANRGELPAMISRAPGR